MSYPKYRIPKPTYCSKTPKPTRPVRAPKPTEEKWVILDPVVKDVMEGPMPEKMSQETLKKVVTYCRNYSSNPHFDVEIYKKMELLVEQFSLKKQQQNEDKFEDDDEDYDEEIVDDQNCQCNACTTTAAAISGMYNGVKFVIQVIIAFAVAYFFLFLLKIVF